MEAVGMGTALPNVFGEWTFLKAPGEGKMVPTSRVCLRVAFFTISKSPAKKRTISHNTYFVTLCLYIFFSLRLIYTGCFV